MRPSYFTLFLMAFTFCIGTATLRAQVPVSFEYHESLIFVKAKINSNKAFFLFLLNTGANRTVIDKRTAGILKLSVIKELDTVEGTAGKEPVDICYVKSIQIGNLVVKNIEVTQRDLSRFITYKGQKIDGVIGTDVLQKYAMTIDFKNRKLTFASPKKLETKLKCFPFELADGIPRCMVKLNDTLQTYLNYNSGVSLAPDKSVYVNVSPEQWKELKKLTPFMAHGKYMNGKGVGGDVYMQVVRIHNMTINKTDIRMPYVIVQNKDGYFKRDDAVGFFGNNLLEKYSKVTVDFPNQRVVIEQINKPVVRKGQKIARKK